MNTRLTLERSVKERLENRILFDAVPDINSLNSVELTANESHGSAQIQSLPVQTIEQSAPREIIFVDERVSGSSQLIADIISKQPDRYFEIRALSASHDGIEQISSYLKSARNVAAIHLLSHGDEGALLVGSTSLTNESLANYADQLGSWRQALDPQADLLLYGCRVAAGAQGQHFVRELSMLTGADVAASNNLSGQLFRSDADWDLEFQTGRIESRSLVADSDLIDWFGLLSVSIAATETRVNTTTGGNQVTHSESPNAVAMDSAGNYVVVWTSAGQDGSGNGVYAQRYLANGIAAGTEFRINTTTANDQQNASVARMASGDFVVTWSSNNQDGSNWGNYARRFDAAGTTLGVETRVNTTTLNDQRNSRVAIDPQGNFVIVWASNLQDGSGWGIYAQRYNASGVAQGGEFQVNTTTANNQQFPMIGMDNGGNFTITWTSTNQDGNNNGVYGRRFDSLGNAISSEFLVNTTTNNAQQFSSLAVSSSGDFVTVWSGNVTGDTAGIGLQQVIVDYRESAVYGIDNNSPFNIFEVDPNTGAQTVVGTALFASASLARDAETNRLYYTEFNVTNGRVGYFDPARNANVLLGNLGASVPYLPRLAFNTNGVLYGMAVNNALYIVNIASLTSTLIRATGTGALAALAHTKDNLLLAASGTSLYSLNKTTGAATLIGTGTNSMANLATLPRATNLTVSKSSTPGTYQVGQNYTYTLAVSNTGPGFAAGPIVITDSLPTGANFVSASGTNWSFNVTGQNITATRVGGLATGAVFSPITITISVTNNATSSLTNTAIAGTGSIDRNIDANGHHRLERRGCPLRFGSTYVRCDMD